MRIRRTKSFPQDDKGFPQINEEFSTGIPQSYEVFHRFVIVFHRTTKSFPQDDRSFPQVFHSFIRVFHRANLINPYKHYNYF